MENTLDSNQARKNWRDLLDATIAEQVTIIERYNKPVAAVIPYNDYVAVKDFLIALHSVEQSPESGVTESRSSADSLLALAGHYASGKRDVSERAEEILEADIDRVSGLAAD